MHNWPTRGMVLGALATVAVCALLVSCGLGQPESATPATATTPVGSQPSPATTTTGTTQTAPLSVAGFEMRVPGSWKITSQPVIGTAMQQRASECRSAEIVDAPAPSGSAVADLERAALQICVLPRQDKLTLDQWLTGQGVTPTTRTTYGACEVLTPRGDATRRLGYVQSSDHRAEIATTITSPPSKAPQRAREIAASLSTMRCPSS